MELNQYEEKMKKSLANLEEEYGAIRAGRANPRILDRIQVDYYGTPTSLQGVANISVPEARMIQIQPWDAGLIKDIEKAILASDLGLTPANDGKVIRLVFPELTEERRKELAKDIKKKGEGAKVAVRNNRRDDRILHQAHHQAKVAIRNIRRDANDAVKKEAKANEISEDDQKQLEDKIQKLTDEYVKKIDQAIDAKSTEVMTV